MRVMRSCRWVATGLLALVLASACGQAKPQGAAPAALGSASPSASPALDRGIEHFDFGNARWEYFEEHQLVNGKATFSTGSDEATLSVGDEPPVFADADGDGDLDAMVALHVVDGNAFNTIWDLWMWDGGTARQLSPDVMFTTRCGGTGPQVLPVADGFEVRTLTQDMGRSCADGGYLPSSYVVGIRAGFPVRLHPRLAPIEDCDDSLNRHVSAAGPVTLRAAADPSAPAVTPAFAPKDILVQNLPDKDFVREEWHLALVDSGTEQFCGYVNQRDLRR